MTTKSERRTTISSSTARHCNFQSMLLVFVIKCVWFGHFKIVRDFKSLLHKIIINSFIKNLLLSALTMAGFFITPTEEKIKTQGKTHSQKLKRNSSLGEHFASLQKTQEKKLNYRGSFSQNSGLLEGFYFLSFLWRDISQIQDFSQNKSFLLKSSKILVQNPKQLKENP